MWFRRVVIAVGAIIFVEASHAGCGRSAVEADGGNPVFSISPAHSPEDDNGTDGTSADGTATGALFTRTLSILKPDAVAGGHVNAINARFERNGLHVVAQKRLRLTKEQAEKFYEIHRGKPYYESLCEYMSSGDVVVQVLAGVNAVSKNRELMGATNSATARPGTIRRDYGTDSQRNAVHGSDSDKTAEQEIALFFGELELMTGAHPVF